MSSPTVKTPASPNGPKGDFPAAAVSETEAKKMKILAIKAHMKPITDMMFNREGDMIFTSSKEPGACAWRADTGALAAIYDTKKAVSGIDVNGETTLLVTAGLDYFVRVFNIQTGDQLCSIEMEGPCKAVGFSHDDRMLFVAHAQGKNSFIKVYNLPETLLTEPVKVKFNPILTIQSDEGQDITCCVWGPTNETLYYGDKDGQVMVYNIDLGKEIAFSNPHNKPVNRLHFSLDFTTLISCGMDNYACLLDPRDVKVIQKYHSVYPVFDATISPISDHVLLGGGVSAELVTTSGGESQFSGQFYHMVHENLLGNVKLHFGTIMCIRYHPSGKIFASAGVDGHVKICQLPEFVLNNAPGAVPLFKKAGGDDEYNEDYEEGEYEEGDEDYLDEEAEEAGVAELDDI